MKALGRRRAVEAEPSPPPLRRASGRRIDVVAVGVSTGGPNALAEVFPRLPGNLAVPVVVVQHMPPLFTRMLARRLDGSSGLRVAEGEDGAAAQPGDAWIAPGDHHMTLARDGAQVVIRLDQNPPEHSCRPAVDPLFRSVADAFGPHALAVVLTGMGQDGLEGCQAIVDAGGQVIVQDEASSVVWGMPGFVARAGLAQAVLPVTEIASEIEFRLRRGRIARSGGAAA